MISKELLIEVLGIKERITHIDVSVKSKYVFWYYLTETSYSAKEKKINIYELAHKCKVWAYTAIEPCGIIASNFAEKGNAFLKTGGIDDRYFYANTEPEAVFKACEWILAQTKEETK